MNLTDFIGVGGMNAAATGTLAAGAIIFLLVVVIWSLVWKGIALWKSARKGHLIWFIVLLIVNTVGILEILYIYVFSERSSSKPASQVSRKKKR